MPRAQTPVITERINPDAFYRKHSPVVRAAIGLGHIQIDEAVKAGKLEPPVPAVEGSRACGYLGSTLLEIQNRRLAKMRAKMKNLTTAYGAGAPKTKRAKRV
jgi:hypothetical protein